MLISPSPLARPPSSRSLAFIFEMLTALNHVAQLFFRDRPLDQHTFLP